MPLAATAAEAASLDKELCLVRPEEAPLLERMRSLLPAELLPDAAALAAQPDVFGDLRMLRFLRGHSQDVEAAAEAYGSMLAWRQTNDIEGTVRSTVLGKELTEASLPHFERITELGLKGAINAGWTADGQLISISLDGAGDPSELLASTSEEELSAFFRAYFELRCIVHDATSRRNRLLARSLAIRDLKGAGTHLLKHATAVMVFKRVLSEALQYYPESTQRVLFLNTPTVFSAVWSIIK